MKIVFLITRLDYSGGPKMLAWVANQFAKTNNNVSIIAIYSDKIGQPLKNNIQFYSLCIKQSKNRLIRNSSENLKVQFKLEQILRQIKPDIVVGFLYPVDLYLTLINHFTKKYKIILSQRFDPYSEKGITSKIKKRIVKMADGIIFQTPGARDYYGNIRKKNIIIPNPVTERTLKYKSIVKDFYERENIIVLPARLDLLQKRQDVMIKAFNIVLTLHPEMKLVLLGDGPDKEKIKKIIDEYNLNNYVEIHAEIPTAEEFTVRCKIVCLTSDYEGMPNSIIEALALGLNVVATDCRPGGAKTLIEDGKNGFLVPRNDYKELAKKIIFLLENPQKAVDMGKEAIKICDDLNENYIGSKWIEFISNI